ncbi:MAG: phage tail protein [Methylococcales bacterium]|nr:phage tail protein [Methylococcales bacterium]
MISMILGSYIFSLHTAAYETLQRTTSYRWKAQERIGQRPAQQFLGIGSDEITLNGTILPDFAGGHSQIVRMKSSAEEGKPLMLVSGTGAILGKWCIVKIAETNSILLSNGVGRKIEFTMNLIRYGEDDE